MQRILVAVRPTITASEQQSSSPLVSDSFDRADSTTSLGTADSGQTWTALAGTWGIQTNRAYGVGTSPIDKQVVVESGASDVTVSVDVAVFDTDPVSIGPGIVFRAVDASNYLLFCAETAGRWALYKRVNGNHTEIASMSETPVAGKYEVTCSGSTITCKVGGVTKITATDTTHQTATRHGIRDYKNSTTASANRFDNFKIESLGAKPLVSDAFDRADNTTALGTADTGQAWGTQHGTWGIASNQAYSPALSGGDAIVLIEAGAANVEVSCNIAHQGNNGVLFRSANASNLLLARLGDNALQVYKREGGTWALLSSVAMTLTAGQTYALRVVASGSTIDIYVGGVKQITITESFQSTITTQGLYSGSTLARWDNFKVEAI